MKRISQFLCWFARELVPPLLLRAGETADGKAVTVTTEETPEYKNWIEFGIGGSHYEWRPRQFEQEHRLPGDQPYGGIQDLHFEQTFGKTTRSVDGHALLDTNDYDIHSAIVEAKARLH